MSRYTCVMIWGKMAIRVPDLAVWAALVVGDDSEEISPEMRLPE